MSIPGESKKGVTFAGQDDLKKLPIPELQDTVDRYLSTVAPFQVRDEQFYHTTYSEEFYRTRRSWRPQKPPPRNSSIRMDLSCRDVC